MDSKSEWAVRGRWDWKSLAGEGAPRSQCSSEPGLAQPRSSSTASCLLGCELLHRAFPAVKHRTLGNLGVSK